ncbi:MAG TPA: hypothetical protein VKR06_10625 [Ktedonosporobacter sp.]|nr:hypothetical protein [Ktedonosporobacter sp.]
MQSTNIHQIKEALWQQAFVGSKALVANIPGQSDELEPYKENEFRLKSAPAQMITFIRGADGQVSEARLPGGVTAKRKA